MAKKNRDLFEILGSRSGAAASGIVQRVQEAVSPSAKSKKSGRGKSGRSSRSKRSDAGSGVPSLVLAAVAFGCLAIGFVAGRWSGGESGPVQDLNRRVESNERGERPGRIQAAPLDGEKLFESLSQYGYWLLLFPIPDTADGAVEALNDAKRLAEWLRERDFLNVRLRRMGSSKTGKEYWVVVDYVDSPDDVAEYERLRELESPAFAPSLGPWIEKNNTPRKML